eukprot:scaffold22404_cov112-Isochrysis_galbana.AAC.9
MGCKVCGPVSRKSGDMGVHQLLNGWFGHSQVRERPPPAEHEAAARAHLLVDLHVDGRLGSLYCLRDDALGWPRHLEHVACKVEVAAELARIPRVEDEPVRQVIEPAEGERPVHVEQYVDRLAAERP